MPLFHLTPTWQRIAASGSTVEVQSLGNGEAHLLVSDSAPDGTDPGITLFQRTEKFDSALPSDLYACSFTNTSVEVIRIGAVGGSSTSSTTATAAANTNALHSTFAAFGLLGASTAAS